MHTLARMTPPTLSSLLGRALALSRPLTLLGLVMLALLAATLVGLAVDGRTVTGAPVWLKPAKFAASIAIYSFTLLWLLGFIEGHRRLVRIIMSGVAGLLTVEIVIIVFQAARGVASHFNDTTPFDAALFAIMGGAIMVLWLLNAVAAVLLLFQRLPDRAFAWSLRLGLLLSLIGMALALPMASVFGAHSVGVPDGGAGLPVTGWSTQGGDLRIAHFIGLHGLQILPLLGWRLARRARELGVGHRLALVWIGGLAYLGLTLLLFWQALRGQPLLAPDGLTLAAGAVLVAATAAGAAGVLLHARRGAPAIASHSTA